MQKYIKVSSNKKGVAQSNLWFEHCKKLKCPFIKIIVRNKYADVIWDYITYPIEYDKTIKDKEEILGKGFFEIYGRYLNDRGSEIISIGLMAIYKKIEKSKADCLAEELYDYICKVLET